jgi:uncharacterized membrane protein
VSALPRNYRVQISAKDFKTVQRNLELQVAQVGEADFTLELGEQSETVTVEAGSPVINS